MPIGRPTAHQPRFHFLEVAGERTLGTRLFAHVLKEKTKGEGRNLTMIFQIFNFLVSK